MVEAYEESKVELYVTLSEDGSHIVAYPPPVFSEMIARHIEKSQNSESREEREREAAHVERMSFAAQRCPMDSQGRVRLGKELVDRVSLPKEVMVCGKVNHLVILTLEDYERRMRADGR